VRKFAIFCRLVIANNIFNCYNFRVCSSSGVGGCNDVWRVPENSRLTNRFVVGMQIGVMKKEEMYTV